MRTRPGLSYKVAKTAELDETLEAIEIDRFGERLSHPMARHEVRLELKTLRSKLVTWERVVDSESKLKEKGRVMKGTR